MTRQSIGITALTLTLCAGTALAQVRTSPTDRDQQRNQQTRLGTQQNQQNIRLHKADDLIGSDLHGADGESIGRIDDFIIDRGSGSIAFAVVSTGGVLGMGGQQTAVPYQKLNWTPGEDRFQTNMTQEQLENQAEFLPENWNNLQDTSWMGRMDGWTWNDQDDEAYEAAIRGARGEMKTLRGTVVDVRRDDPMGADNERVVLELQTEDGDRKEVVLGPSWYVTGHDGAPLRGQTVTVQGREHDGQFVAWSVGERGSEMRLRQDDGRSMWQQGYGNRDLTDDGTPRDRIHPSGGDSRDNMNRNQNRDSQNRDNQNRTGARDTQPEGTPADRIHPAGGDNQTQTDRNRQDRTDTTRQTQTDRDRQNQTDRDRQTQTDRDRQTQPGQTGQDRDRQTQTDRTRQDRTDTTRQNQTGQDRDRQTRTGQDRTGAMTSANRTVGTQYILLSDLIGANAEARGVSSGEIEGALIESNSGKVAFLLFDPNENFLGIGDETSLVPWSVAYIDREMTVNLDADADAISRAMKAPDNLETLNNSQSLNAAYQPFNTRPAQFRPRSETMQRNQRDGADRGAVRDQNRDQNRNDQNRDQNRDWNERDNRDNRDRTTQPGRTNPGGSSGGTNPGGTP